MVLGGQQHNRDSWNGAVELLIAITWSRSFKCPKKESWCFLELQTRPSSSSSANLRGLRSTYRARQLVLAAAESKLGPAVETTSGAGRRMSTGIFVFKGYRRGTLRDGQLVSPSSNRRDTGCG